MTMVRLIDNATFRNREALLGEVAELAAKLEHPKASYPEAARVVHGVLRAAGRRAGEPFEGDGSRPGHTVPGGPSDAVGLIWPHLSKTEHDRARAAVSRYLQESGNAACLEQGRTHSLGLWWVAESWADIEPKPRGRKPARPRRARVKAAPAAPAPLPVAGPGLAEPGDPLALASELISEAQREMKRLRDENLGLRAENEELRNRLETISIAVAGAISHKKEH